MGPFDLDTWNEIGETVRSNKLRTFLTACGVFWGMFMLLLMLGFGDGLEKGVRRTLGDFATNAVFIWGQRTSMPFRGQQPGRSVDYDNADLEAIRTTIPGIRHLAPRSQLGGWRQQNTIRRGNRSSVFQVMGDVPEYQHIQLMDFVHGRFLNQLDLRDQRKVAVIGEFVYNELFPDREDPIGDHVEINGVWFQVIGVFSSPLASDDGERQESTVHIPLSIFQQAFNQRDEIGWFALEAEPWASSELMEEEVRALLKDRHGIHPDDDPAIGSFNAEQEFRKMQNTFAGINAFVWFVGTMTLLTGVFGVSNIMLIVVRERTREIGVRRALGATRGSIISLIMQESIVLTAVSGYTGLVAGVFVLQVVGALVGDDHDVLGNPQVDFQVAMVAAALLVVAGAVAGVIPARRAARIHPVEALRADG